MNASVQRIPLAGNWPGSAALHLSADSRLALTSGNEMPVIGLGTAQLKHHTVDSVARAFHAGYRMIDTCGDYHTQRGIGDALRSCGLGRSSLFIVTKIDATGDAYAEARTNLAELRIDYVDLVLMQPPPGHGVGESCWQGLRRAKRDGLTRDIGVSNYTLEQIEELVYRTGELPAVNQVEWSPFGPRTTKSSSRPIAR